MKFQHKPVLVSQVLEYVNPQPNENAIDCTLGGGGHALEILKKTSPNGKLLGIDLDTNAIKASKNKLKSYKDRTIFVNDNYKNIKQILYAAGINNIHIILLDLGLSSYQLQEGTRGFSFKGNTVLDMRFGQTELTAADILNNYKEEELVRIFKEYGQERFAKLIAKEIVKQRKEQKIFKTSQLIEVIEKVYKNKPKPRKIHIATKVFQALRIEVNDELNNLKTALPDALNILEKGGRLAVISFHSLEDKIVKQFFKQESKDCLCPPQIPVCQCKHKAQLKIITKKPIIPNNKEIKPNPRSRSAKLRVAVKI